MTAAPAILPNDGLRIVLPIMNFFSLARTRLAASCITGTRLRQPSAATGIAARRSNSEVEKSVSAPLAKQVHAH